MNETKRKSLSFPAKMRATLRVKGRCPYCESPLSVAFEEGKPTHFDHMLPIKRGGTNDDHNMVACCADCNIAKGTKTVFEFMCQRMGLQIPVWAHYDPEGEEYDWFDSDTFLAGADEHDDEQADDEAVVASLDEDVIDDSDLEIEDTPPMDDEDDPETNPPLYAGRPRAVSDDSDCWIPLGTALMSAFEKMPDDGGVVA